MCIISSIGYRHSQLSSFGTSNFFKKILCTRTGIFLFVSSQLWSPLAGAVALFVLRFLHSTGYLCFIDQMMSNKTVFWNLLVSEIVLSTSNLIVLEELSMHW